MGSAASQPEAHVSTAHARVHEALKLGIVHGVGRVCIDKSVYQATRSATTGPEVSDAGVSARNMESPVPSQNLVQASSVPSTSGNESLASASLEEDGVAYDAVDEHVEASSQDVVNEQDAVAQNQPISAPALRK
ncbi:hypothetical protein V6N11_000578 [Hibiscus sabdariffa]|uniref:Uncharacterized protein n=1 Tax=Hibiscus sabdariffa TaxID=183260 RepID=A0ABR2NTE6_9ROSI